jgi:hypothetical protein
VKREEVQNETSPPTISTSGRRRCRAAGRIALRLGADLSGSAIATEAVVRAPADGYTLLLVGAPHVINATLYDKLNFIRDIAPVAASWS